MIHLPARCGKAHLDVEAAFRPGTGGERGMVGAKARLVAAAGGSLLAASTLCS